MVYCNNDKCDHHNEKGFCNLINTYVDIDSCVSRRKKEQQENYTELMKSSKPKGYKRNGKWVHN